MELEILLATATGGMAALCRRVGGEQYLQFPFLLRNIWRQACAAGRGSRHPQFWPNL